MTNLQYNSLTTKKGVGQLNYIIAAILEDEYRVPGICYFCPFLLLLLLSTGARQFPPPRLNLHDGSNAMPGKFL